MEKKQERRKSLDTVIRKRLIESGETIVVIAKKCRVSGAQLSRFINGKRDLKLSSAEKICKAYGLQLTPVPDPKTDSESA